MMKPIFARISCTIPADLLEIADQVAAREQRPRSWVISEALRHHLTKPARPAVVREQAVAPDGVVATGLGESRLAQLKADLRLSPEDRIRAAEETAALSALIRPSRGPRLIQFDRFEDYLDWKRREAAGA